MFTWKTRSNTPAESVVLQDDLEALEAMLLSILDIVRPTEAWQHFQLHADIVRERAGSYWPVVEEAMQEMLARHGVARPGG
jgi:hypothetical protein